MPNNLCIIEDKEDFKLFKKNINPKDCIFVPLNIETLIECIKAKFNIIDFKKYLDNEFHQSALLESKRFTDSIKFNHKIEYSLKSEIIALLRFRLHSSIFLIELIKRSIKDLNFRTIVVSGITKNIHSLHDSKIVTDIIINLYGSITNTLIKQNIKIEHSPRLFEYFTLTSPQDDKQKILMSNGGYNFSKLSKLFKKKDIDCWIPIFTKMTLLKKLYYKYYLKLNLIIFQKNTNIPKAKKSFIQPIDFSYKKNFELSNLLNLFVDKLEFHFNDINEKINSIKNFVNQNKFNLALSNIVRGVDGSILDKNLSLPSLCISHGTICKGFNKFDEIYKKIIAEAVFNGDSKYFSIQSKIMHNSLQTHKISGKKVITGNLIFANKQNNKKGQTYLLFASTVKDFSNLHFLGVEMFYEYWKTLNDLDYIANKFKEKIVVKVHPSIALSSDELKKIFRNLIFSNSKIDNLLKNASALLSYSSSSIEDSLNSKVPVLLYDPYKRYEHLKAISPNAKDEPIHYIETGEKLIETIKQIKNTKMFNFDNYIYHQNFYESVNKNIIPLLD